jgi:hypothetical protein
MTDLDPQLLDMTLKFILKVAASPTLKAQYVRLLRGHVVDLCESASPRLRRQLLEDHEAALEFWLTDYIAPPTPIYTYTKDEN